MKLTRSVADVATRNMLVKERVYNRLLANGFTPTASKGNTYFEWEVFRAVHDIRRLVAQETLA